MKHNILEDQSKWWYHFYCLFLYVSERGKKKKKERNGNIKIWNTESYKILWNNKFKWKFYCLLVYFRQRKKESKRNESIKKKTVNKISMIIKKYIIIWHEQNIKKCYAVITYW